MPFTSQRLVLAITLALGATGIQYAQARGDMEPDSERLIQNPVDGTKEYHYPALPEPTTDFYFADHATSRNGLRAAHVMDTAVDTLLESDELTEWDRYELENIGAYLGGLEPGRVGAVLEQLAATQNANLGTATQNSMKQLNTSLLTTLRQLSDNSAENSNGRFWFQGLGNTGRLDSQHGSAGLQQRTQGLLLGADWAVDHAWRVGVMGAKTGSDLSAKRFKGELDSWHLGGYAVRQDGPLALRLGAIYSDHNGQNKRGVDFDFVNYKEQVTGKYDAQSQNAFAELGYQLDKGNLNVEPFAGIGYQRYHRDRFKEKGGLVALNVGEQKQENLSSTFGVRLASLHSLDNQMTLKPHLSTSWKHLYGNVDSQVRQSSILADKKDFNSDFTINGTALDRDSLALQAGLDIGLSAHQTIGLTYTGEFGSNSRNQGIMGQWAMGNGQWPSNTASYSGRKKGGTCPPED
ncbi:autotransporter outer membrane beta-barrel domain-containing protein [Pseudomonas fluorescens]|uniref:autotransporter outer membrane beta-barrel domain-containing protein n=1 Tax=Pseudomonas fluorescens TaxID=294 RepID=UPI001BE7FFCF|nr:autotransporter outer membrane beta-barrel domain-containing protein [Pseudomonas fluorescens]MBT2371550.1 autotransporter outer membrane beta-barrel domain-containing protein [Pseudomonas fluorescens]